MHTSTFGELFEEWCYVHCIYSPNLINDIQTPHVCAYGGVVVVSSHGHDDDEDLGDGREV